MTKQVRPHREPTATETVGTVCELFAGVGGFRIALSRSGLKTTFSNQWEPSTLVQHASACYVYNFGPEGHSNVNITDLVDQHVASGGRIIPKTDIIVGGYPCQDYSVAKSLNSSKGLKGKKGVLWWDIHKLIEANKPKYVFLENVDRLLKSPSKQRGRDFAVMLNTLGSLGYLIEWRVVNAAEYGFPQRRIRVLIVATRTRRAKPLNMIEAKELIEKTGVLARALPVENFDFQSIREIDISDAPNDLSESFGKDGNPSPFENAGIALGGRIYTTRTTASSSVKKRTLGDVLIRDDVVPAEYWVPSDRLDEWRYLKGAKSISRIHKGSGEQYKYAEGGMAFPDLLTNPSRTILTGEGGSSPSRFKHIIETPQGFRRLVPLELERLSGFPDNWTKRASDDDVIADSRRAFFIGNALVVDLIERVGNVLSKDLALRKMR
jgi:DNA (cytosine-5)-methyltransferase 1